MSRHRKAADPGGSRNRPRPERVEEDDFAAAKRRYESTYPKRRKAPPGPPMRRIKR